jgi:hypothetical protein
MKHYNRVVIALAVGALVAVALAPVAWAQVPFQPAPAPQQPVQPAPQGPQLAPQPAPSSPVERIKSELTRQGQRVLEVGIVPPQGGNPGIWYAGVAASYAQPSQPPVLQQAFNVWAVIFGVAGGEPPQTIMSTNQVWTKYALLVMTQVGPYAELLTRLRSATSNAAKSQVFNDFVARVGFRVFDLERQQFVDQKDFINRNFTR